jgi:hypothetical protein
MQKIVKPEVFPAWFSLPDNGHIMANFYENPKHPKDFKLPKGKYSVGEILIDANIPSDENRNSPLLRYGFTHISHLCQSAGQKPNPKNKTGSLLSDTLWIKNANNPYDINNWSSARLIEWARTREVLILDFEMVYPGDARFTKAHYAKLDQIAREVLKEQPNLLIGLWAWGLLNATPFLDKTGGLNSASAYFWASLYDDKSSAYTSGLHNVFNVGVPFWYVSNMGDPAQYFEVLQAIEVSKIKKPKLKVLPTLWFQEEIINSTPLVDKSPFTRIDTKKGQKILSADFKRIASGSYMYNSALISLCIGDGFYHFDEGAISSEDTSFWFNPAAPNRPNTRINGQIKTIYYKPQYQGLYNFLTLAMWQLSQEPYKSILETDTNWIIPDFKEEGKYRWTTGMNARPSYCVLNESPLIRIKYDNFEKPTKCMVLALHPFQDINESICAFRDPNNSTWESNVELIGQWATLGIIEW